MNNSRTPIDPDLKTFFELTVLKQLFEDNFLAFVNGKPGTLSALELAEQALSIAKTQGYSDFDVAHRTQLVIALEEVMNSYRDICNKYSVMAQRFPDVKFSILGGWRHYRIFNDGINGNILKIVSEVRMAHGRTALELFNEDIINATVYLVDRYNYNYRTDQLEEWRIQDNLVVWNDIIQGNGFLNFILTKARTAAIPMRVVVSTTTRPMVKPIPVPPTPVPPPPCPVPPGPFPPGPFPPPPQPSPGPYPPPGPQPTPIYPPHPPVPPAPVPFWPPPPPPPPVIADCALVRQVVAERTVGGIHKGDVLPAGLTFTLFVEWLLRGEGQPEDVDPTGVVTLDTSTPPAGYAATVNFTITDKGTSEPHTVYFYERDILLSGAMSPREDRLIGTMPYVEGQTTYKLPLSQLPQNPVEYWVTMNYTRKHEQSEDIYTSNKVPYIPETHIEQNLYFGPVPVGAMPETTDEIKEMEKIDLNSDESKAALAGSGVKFVVHCKLVDPATDTVFFAMPTELFNTLKWYSMDGATPVVLPDERKESTIIDGINYTKFLWVNSGNLGFVGDTPFVLKYN